MFAEDTDIFYGKGLFTATIEQMSARDSSNTHEVIGELFRSMNTKITDRAATKLPRWADVFPYVNDGLFYGSPAVPRFSRIARSYLIHIGGLDWTKINPDIFGSMIQAVADDEERGALGMHYTSVPNILKVLNPLFLDDLQARLEEAGSNSRMLLNLRRRMARIRVFDPACGSGNFLVIAYKEMRAIEAVINERRGESDRASEIPLTNFRGIELRNFPAEVARLALIMAEFQCDVLYRGQKLALAEFLPLNQQNWITCGNALRLDWLSVCPPTGTGVKLVGDDLFQTPLDQAQIDFENEGGETYICGNPPYVWTNDQTPEQKADLQALFSSHTTSWRTLNYISGWFLKLAQYGLVCDSQGAFVSINTICQGQHAAIFWPVIYKHKHRIIFAHEPFKWNNLAANNAGVTVVIIGLASEPISGAALYSEDYNGKMVVRKVDKIGPYLVPSLDVIVSKHSRQISSLSEMLRGNMPYEGGYLLLSAAEKQALVAQDARAGKFVKRISGSAEIIDGKPKYCIWINDNDLEEAQTILPVQDRLEQVKALRLSNADQSVVAMAATPHRFREMNRASYSTIAMPAVSSEARIYLPVELLPPDHIITN